MDREAVGYFRGTPRGVIDPVAGRAEAGPSEARLGHFAGGAKRCAE